MDKKSFRKFLRYLNYKLGPGKSLEELSQLAQQTKANHKKIVEGKHNGQFSPKPLLPKSFPTNAPAQKKLNALQKMLTALIEQLHRYDFSEHIEQQEGLYYRARIEAHRKNQQPIPAKLYTQWQKELDEQIVCPIQMLDNTMLSLKNFFYDMRFKGPDSYKDIFRLKQRVDDAHLMISSLVELEITARSLYYQTLELPENKPLPANQAWLNIYISLRRLFIEYPDYDQKAYFALKKQAFEALPNLNPYNAIFLCEHMLSYLYGAIKRGILRSYDEIAALAIYRLKHDLVTPINEISVNDYLNFLSILANAQEIKYFQTFRQTYERLVPLAEKNRVSWIADQIFNLHQKNYLAVLQGLEEPAFKNNPQNISYQLRILTNRLMAALALSVQYPLQDYDVDETFLLAHKNLLTHISRSNGTKLKKHESPLEAFARISMMLYQKCNSGSINEKDKIEVKKAIETVKVIHQPEWLLNLVESIKTTR